MVHQEAAPVGGTTVRRYQITHFTLSTLSKHRGTAQPSACTRSRKRTHVHTPTLGPTSWLPQLAPSRHTLCTSEALHAPRGATGARSSSTRAPSVWPAWPTGVCVACRACWGYPQADGAVSCLPALPHQVKESAQGGVQVTMGALVGLWKKRRQGGQISSCFVPTHTCGRGCSRV